MSTAPTPNFALATFGASGTFAQDSLLLDGDEVTSRTGVLAAAAGKFTRGQVVNFNPTTLIVIPAVLGTSAPNAIVAENADATIATQPVLIYLTGSFRASAMIWPPTGSRSAIADVLRQNGITVQGTELASGAMTSATVGVHLTPTSAAPTNAGGSATFAVAKDQVGGPGTWLPSSDASWLTITSPTVAQTADGNVSYTTSANASGVARVGHIYVNGQTFTVTQAA